MPSVHICTGPKTDEKCIVGLFFLQNVDKGYKCRYILYYNIFPDKNEKLALYGLRKKKKLYIITSIYPQYFLPTLIDNLSL